MAGAMPPPPPPNDPNASPAMAGWSPQHQTMPMMAMRHLIIGWSRALGFILLFLGTLVAVILGSIPADCLSTTATCPSSWGPNWAWAILTAHVLWTLGLFFIGAGAGAALTWGQRPAPGSTPEQYRWMSTERWFNFLLLVVTIVLLWFLLAGVSSLFSVPIGSL